MNNTAIFWYSVFALGYLVPCVLAMMFVKDRMEQVYVCALWSFACPIFAAVIAIVINAVFYQEGGKRAPVPIMVEGRDAIPCPGDLLVPTHCGTAHI